MTLIPPHGGYQDLMSYQMAEIVHDATAVFCSWFIDKRSRTNDQMVQAARSGKQNIAEGCMVSGTSKKTELKLIGVARASLEELLVDYKDFLRQRSLPLWPKDDPQAVAVRGICYRSDRSYLSYKSYLETGSPETAGNTLVCIINQTNYLLDRQLRALPPSPLSPAWERARERGHLIKEFLTEGSFTERLYQARSQTRGK